MSITLRATQAIALEVPGVAPAAWPPPTMNWALLRLYRSPDGLLAEPSIDVDHVPGTQFTPLLAEAAARNRHKRRERRGVIRTVPPLHSVGSSRAQASMLWGSRSPLCR
jgi:hypothetical protein